LTHKKFNTIACYVKNDGINDPPTCGKKTEENTIDNNPGKKMWNIEHRLVYPFVETTPDIEEAYCQYDGRRKAEKELEKRNCQGIPYGSQNRRSGKYSFIVIKTRPFSGQDGVTYPKILERYYYPHKQGYIVEDKIVPDYRDEHYIEKPMFIGHPFP
jgi:hypothetical protein